MNIIGLDMSTNSSGYSLFKDGKLVDYGKWEAPSELKGKENWRERIYWMSKKADTYIKENNVEKVYVEDVPLSSANPNTLKMLSALQGCIMAVCQINSAWLTFISVSAWRSSLGLFNGTRKGTTREEMKQSSIEYVNSEFGLDLVWKSKSSKFNEDDISDAINVAYSQIKSTRGNFGGKKR